MKSKLNGKRLFIVEDSSQNRVIYTMLLKLTGAVLEFDVRGRDTVRRLEDFHPNLVILDLMLPHGDSGFEIFDAIRELPEYADVPIVAISASDSSTAIPKCQKAGFSGFIAKPIEDELLEEQLIQLIEGEQLWYAGKRFGGMFHSVNKSSLK